MTGKGTGLTCRHCGKHWELTPIGDLAASEGETEFSHVPDWYRWEREQVRRELEDGTYKLDIDVDIAMMVDFKAIYKVGQGHLTHDRDGFTLTGCGGKLRYTQKPTASYGLYADYYWYEIADTSASATTGACITASRRKAIRWRRPVWRRRSCTSSARPGRWQNKHEKSPTLVDQTKSGIFREKER